MIVVQFCFQLLYLAKIFQQNSFASNEYMAVKDYPDPYNFTMEHVSYQIEEQQKVLMRHILHSSLVAQNEERE